MKPRNVIGYVGRPKRKKHKDKHKDKHKLTKNEYRL
jgi:hypothetical protein